MDLALEIYHAVRDFLERGGAVLLLIAGVVFVMWTLILERLLYMSFEHPAEVMRGLSGWESRRGGGSWHSEQIYIAMVSRLSMRLQAGTPMIKTLAAVCPLLGLLGTVTGMILIFDAVNVMGSSSARAVAGGVSTAIVTTMAGLVGALSGIFPAALLARRAKDRARRLRVCYEHPPGAAYATPLFRIARGVRCLIAPIGGALITVTLLIGMEKMIVTGKAVLTAYTQGFPVEFVRVERTETVQQRARKPDKLPRPEEMPAWTPDAEAVEAVASGSAIKVAEAAPSVDFAAARNVSGFAGFISDGDYLPVLKVAPIYPRRAEERHLEGWVLLSFSLAINGAVKDIQVLESSDQIFEAAAVAAAAKFKYKPRVVNGEPVEVYGVVNRIIFDLPDA